MKAWQNLLFVVAALAAAEALAGGPDGGSNGLVLSPRPGVSYAVVVEAKTGRRKILVEKGEVRYLAPAPQGGPLPGFPAPTSEPTHQALLPDNSGVTLPQAPAGTSTAEPPVAAPSINPQPFRLE